MNHLKIVKSLVHIILLFLIGFWAPQSLGQSSTEYLERVKVLARPISFTYPKMSQVDGLSQKTAHSYENVWVVYSDRSENAALTKPTLGEPKQSTLDFMQPALVIDENADWVKLVEYKEDLFLKDGKKQYSELCCRVKVLGWVEKQKLLLWEVPLHTENRYAIKALAISTADDLRKYTSEESQNERLQNKLNLYDDPELVRKNKSDFRIFSFLFVYKEDKKGNYLVGKDPQLRNYRQNARKSVLGWVDKNSIEKWEKRLCLEPTKDNYEARNKEMVFNALFEDQTDALQYSMDGRFPLREPIWKKQLKERPSPAIKRLPILKSELGNHGGRLFQTGVVTPIFDTKGDTVWSEEDFTKVTMSKEDRDRQNSQVNLLFVVEDSKEMGPYISQVSELIKSIGVVLEETKRNREMLEKPFQFQLGFVIYREEGAEACGEKPIETYTPSVDFNKVAAQFINKIKQSSCAQSSSFAIFQALTGALNLLKGKSYQTNLIILVGAHGNFAPDHVARSQTIIDQLEQTNTSMLIFQPKNMGDAFFDQLQDIQRGAIEKEMEWIADRYSKKPESPAMKKDDRLDGLGRARFPNMYKYDCPKEAPLPGVIMFADSRSPMKPEDLKSVVLEMVLQIQNEKEKIADDADAFVRGQGERPPMNVGMMHYLASMNIKVDDLRKLSYSNVQLFVKGWTSSNAGSANERQNLYKFVVFLTDKEFSDYLEALQKLDSKSETDEALRQNMEDQFKLLAQNYVGKKEAQNMSLSRLLRLMSEVEVKSEIWNRGIDQIKSMPAGEFEKLRNTLVSKIKGLKNYYNIRENAYSIDEMSYYWVPTELFP